MSMMAIGGRVIEVDSVDSTNKLAADLIAGTGSSHGTVILAHEQTAGRGQRGRDWLSAAGLDLTFSVTLQPVGLAARDQFHLARVAALAVRDAVISTLRTGQHIGPSEPAVAVKWPNDVLIDRRKVAGILIECELAGGLVRHAIAGIGLNVNNLDLPEELMATSLRLTAGGRSLDRMRLFQVLLGHFEARYQQWCQAPTTLGQDYAEALWSRGRWCPMVLDGRSISLRPMDVDSQGRLLVEHDNGDVGAYGLDRLRFAPR